MLPVILTNLSKHFGKTVAVDRLSLSISAGDLFFLLGPSGCGKTTLLRMLAGFTEPTAGTIHFGPRDVTDLPANQRNAGMCFQSYALWPHMTVAQNVAFGLNVRKVPGSQRDKRVAAALELVQMSAYGHRKPNELSGGQQQRVSLARALVIEPDLLLLDEPLSNLDAKLRLEMRSQIRQICKAARITAVYVTHDQKEALSMADTMAVLKDGQVVQMGPPRQLYDRPTNRFVADFLGETNFLPATVLGVEGDRVELECSAGRFGSSVFPRTIQPGQRVTCSLRPESIRLSSLDGQAPSSSASVNCLQAQPVDRVYLGEMAQHHLMAAGDLPIKAFELNPKSPPSAPGQNVAVCFAPADVVVLTD